MRHADFAVQIEIRDADDPDKLLACAPIEPDFGPALECSYLDRSRQSAENSLVLDRDDAFVEPVWNRELGEPVIHAFRIRTNERSEETTVSPQVLLSPTRLALARFIEQGVLEKDQRIVTRFTAGSRKDVVASADVGFEVEDISTAIPLPPGRLEEMNRKSDGYDESHSNDTDDVPIFVQNSVIELACELTQAAGAVETGGILLGRLHRDASPELYLEVTGLIPARKAKGELTKLEFTPECWTDVDAARRLRNQQELMVGWFHSHPARHWCAECPPEKQRKCQLSGEFFSHHDIALHETVFPRAFNVALVVSDSIANGLTWPLFGWRAGAVERRGYRIVHEDPKQADLT